MKDLYQALGITQEASPQDIKKAYRKLALHSHPDRGGNAEIMVLINDAYETLSDPEKRRNFDANWDVFQQANIDAEPDATDGYLQAGPTLPYSQVFKEEHNVLVHQYKQAPLAKNLEDHNQLFESGIYHFKEQGAAGGKYHDIFSFIRAKTKDATKNKLSTPPTLFAPPQQLTPITAVKLFTDFLLGNYFGLELKKLSGYLSFEILKIKSENCYSSEILLYEGMFEIVLITEKTPVQLDDLMIALKKITDYAKCAPTLILSAIIPLFYNKFFRNLYAYALTLYWRSSKNLFASENLKQFDGQEEAKELFNVLKQRLSSNSQNENLSSLIQYVKLLYHFEKDLHQSSPSEKTADDYRNDAFHFLDWIPIFIDQSSRQILVNIFLQIGIKFQQAARLETRPTIKMADERLALKMYLTAVGIGYHSTPDIEIYANTQVLKYISSFEFHDSMLDEIVPALKQRTLIIVDVFPFFESHQSNVAFLRQESKMIHLMRHLLNTMIETYEYNKSHSDGILIDHSSITILYQAYEACLKNWYQEEYDPDVEKKFRLDLMDELLFDNAWTFLDVEQRIDSPWIMVDRDKEGWMKPSRSLPYTEEKKYVKYRAINGAEVNHKTGGINFFMVPWTQDRPIYEKTFTLFDVQEMVEKNLGGAIFSLDPVDPQKPYHPFNLMRFSPSQLCESELLNTMLLTDYVLKFLTTNQEVQGQYPFDQRPVAPMIQHLPEYLRKIIDDFQNEQHFGSLHRFWIEAEELDISLSDVEIKNDDITRIGLGNLKMIVKKHRMERDIHGELKDVGNEDEGWPIYVLTPEQMHELERGKRVIDGHAMIFIYAETKLFYWENNAVLHAHAPKDFRETLIRLYLQPRDSNGKIAQNTKNMPLLYRTTKEMALQSEISHRYSPEFIFAHEFTTHYDEFAQYLPEFGRLKELSKICTLVRLLNGMRQSNEEELQALNYLLNSSVTSPPDTDIYRQYQQSYQKTCENITSVFQDLRQDLASSVLQKKWNEKLNELKNEIGNLYFDSSSPEVNEACQNWHDQISKDNPGVSSSRIWNEVINPKKSDIAKQLSKSKQENCRNQIYNIFSPRLSAPLGASSYGKLIDSFMQGNINPLSEALINYEKTKAQEDMNKQFPYSSTKNIALALDDYGDATAKSIATDESRRQLLRRKETNDKLASGFTQINLGKHEAKVDLEDQCFWVPASVRHEVRRDGTTGLARYSFFVYGGVNIQPHVNIVPGGNGPLGGNAVGGGAFNRTEITRGFQDHHIISPTNHATKNHELLSLAGFNDINSRSNRIYLPVHESQHATRSIHRGRHTQEAMNDVARNMDRIVQKGKAENWSQSQYRSELRTMLSETRQELRAGNIALNSKHRPWAT